MGKPFVTSDEHYGHENIIRYVNRPFSSVEEQTVKLIQKHNAVVGPNDHTWHLGDIFWRTFPVERALWVMRQLNGTHSLVLGNHDELVQENTILQSMFQEIVDLKFLYVPNLKKQRLVLCHYAMRIWRDSHKGAWHLYGHSHAEAKEHGLSFDIGVDNPVCNYAPMSMEQIGREMGKRTNVHAIKKVWQGKEGEDQ